jgi:predicted phosphodiesterase
MASTIHKENRMPQHCHLRRFLSALLVTLLYGWTVAPIAQAATHDCPDPIGHWIFNQRSIEQSKLNARLGLNGTISGEFKLVEDEFGQSLELSGPNAAVLLASDFRKSGAELPAGPFTVSAWVAIQERRRWGSIISVLQDNGSAEKGWILGYRDRNFYFGLATQGADDGDGMMTYLDGQAEYETGRLYHVVGVYDGKRMQLFVNGKLDASSKEQSGAVLYPKSAPMTIGCYRDDDENWPMKGRIRDVALFNLAAKPAWVQKEFDTNKQLAELNFGSDEKFDFVVKPYLQMATQTGITISWQSTSPSTTRVHYGETENCDRQAMGAVDKMLHHVTLTDLEPETQYFYKTESTRSDGQAIESEVRTFQTASKEETPFSFAVISDTQGNPKVSGQVAKMAWAQRPNFLIHPGDLVSTGTTDSHWSQHFFPSMEPLISRVPIYPVLGNHEVNARNYYDYMVLPKPEYYYEFKYGNAHFFMLDSNKKVDPASEQYHWLDQALAKSNSRWKFVVHHHPPYSSDENDYGNLWKTNRSTRGDLRARALTKLYDKHRVNIVFNGHIHSYERTWPLRDGKAVDPTKSKTGQGTIYMITGGGGGGLETPGPYRPFFQHNVRHGHHYMMVHINGGSLQLKSFTLDDRLFDTVQLELGSPETNR